MAEIEKTPAADNGDELLTPDRAARLLGVSEGCLRGYRRRGIGPAFVKFGSGHKPVIRYRREDVRAWILEQRAKAESKTT